MPIAALSDEQLLEAVALRNAHPSAAAAAVAGGVPVTTLKTRLKIAAQRGMMLDSPAAMPGFRVAQVTDGPHGKSIQQREERGAEFEVPTGHVVKGVSTLVDPDGREIVKWIKTREDTNAIDLRDAIKQTFESYAGHAILPPCPTFTDSDLLTILPIVDLHLGLYAWGKETGADYDLKIASKLLKDSVANLVARSANSTAAIILDLGDYFHTDSSKNQTARSKNPLDVDSRYARVVQVGVELAVWTIELALQKHAHVTYRKLPGNHDDETSFMLAIALAAWFRDNPRVTVETDPSRFYMTRFGKNMIAATHGDMLKMGDMASFMASRWPKEWGETEFRYAYTGHVHHDRVKSGGGVRSESFNTLAAKDAWHAATGYTASRSAVSITMHKNLGEVDRLTVTLPR